MTPADDPRGEFRAAGQARELSATSDLSGSAPNPARDLPTVSLRQAGTGAQPLGFADTISGVPAPPPAPPSRLREVGDYELLAEIARGGMGVVYRARQKRLNRIVALKMILSGALASEADIKRFFAEAEAAAALEHPGIVPIYEVGAEHGVHYFSMALVEGPSLSQRLKQGPFAPEEAADVLSEVAAAVHYAHSKGIIHRDLKPHNILLDGDGRPKVTDFGLAKRLDAGDGLTASGDVLGTPSYMAPEQALGTLAAIGPRTDLYALGAMLYALLTGRPPFQAATLAETLRQVVEQEPVPPTLLNRSIPKDLEIVCLKCLEKNPQRRYASASELGDELRRWRRGEPIQARAAGSGERLVRWCRRNPRSAGLLGLSLTALLLLAIGVVYRQQSLHWKQAAEYQQRLVKQQELLVAQQTELARRNEELANLATGMRHFSRAAEIAAKRRPGWSWEALAALRESQRLAPGRLDSARVRTLAAECLAAIDARLVGPVTSEVRASALAFSPDSKLLCVAQHKGAPASSLYQFEVPALGKGRTFTISTAASNAAALFGEILKGNTRKPKFQEGMTAVAYSPDGVFIAAGTRMGKIYLWNREHPRPEPLQQQAFTDHGVTKLVFSPDSTTLFAGCNRASAVALKSFRAATGEHLRDFPAGAEAFALHPAGTLLASHHSQLKFFDSQTAEERLIQVENRDATLEYGPQGSFLMACGSQRISLLHPAHGGLLQSAEVPDVENFAFELKLLAKRGVVAASGADDQIRFFDLGSLRERLRISSQGRSQPPLAVSPDERWLAVAGESTTQLYELRQEDLGGARGGATVALTGVAVAADRAVIAAVGTSTEGSRFTGAEVIGFGPDRELTHCNYSANHFGGRLHDARWGSVALSGDGLRAVVHCPLTGLHWRKTSGAARWPAQLLPAAPRTVQLAAPNLTYPEPANAGELVADVAAASGQSARFSCERTPAGCVRIALPERRGWALGGAVRLRLDRNSVQSSSVNFEWSNLPAGVCHTEATDEYQWCLLPVIWDEKLATGRDIDLRFWADPAVVRAIHIDTIVIYPVSREGDYAEVATSGPSGISRDGKTVYGTVRKDDLVAWEAETGELLGRFNTATMNLIAGDGSIGALAVGKSKVAIAFGPGYYAILNPLTLEPSHFARLGAAELTALAWNADETRLAAGDQIGKVWVIDAGDKSSGGEFAAHDGRVSAIAYSGAQLWSAGSDGAIRKWRAAASGGWELTLALSESPAPIQDMALGDSGSTLAFVRQGERLVRYWRLDLLDQALLPFESR